MLPIEVVDFEKRPGGVLVAPPPGLLTPGLEVSAMTTVACLLALSSALAAARIE